jgi:hypothetical protein
MDHFGAGEDLDDQGLWALIRWLRTQADRGDDDAPLVLDEVFRPRLRREEAV